MSRDKHDVFFLLEEYVPEEYWSYMMYMGKSDNITLYKHCDTRHYINVDSEGNFYRYISGGIDKGKYEKITKEYALELLWYGKDGKAN